LRLFSFGGYGLALAALALVVFGAYDSYPEFLNKNQQLTEDLISIFVLLIVADGMQVLLAPMRRRYGLLGLICLVAFVSSSLLLLVSSPGQSYFNPIAREKKIQIAIST